MDPKSSDLIERSLLSLQRSRQAELCGHFPRQSRGQQAGAQTDASLPRPHFTAHPDETSGPLTGPAGPARSPAECCPARPRTAEPQALLRMLPLPFSAPQPRQSLLAYRGGGHVQRLLPPVHGGLSSPATSRRSLPSPLCGDAVKCGEVVKCGAGTGWWVLPCRFAGRGGGWSLCGVGAEFGAAQGSIMGGLHSKSDFSSGLVGDWLLESRNCAWRRI